MVVIALIGLLTTIAVPAYRGYIERAKTNRAITDIGLLVLELKRWELNTLRYPATLAEAGLDGRLDPWGNEYQYLNLDGATIGDVRKDQGLVPINTLYDLYSKGPDGKSVPPLTAIFSRDDIVLANDGGFIGLATDY
jgi:general secretion pathway protein G